jgi:hypothetical protein
MAVKIYAFCLGLWLNILAFLFPKYAGKVGFKVFCSPFGAKLNEYQKNFLATANQFSIKVDGVNIACYKWGNGQKNILFVHGWASHSFRWKNYIEALDKTDCTIYAYDAMAHGASGGEQVHLIKNAKTIQALISKIGKIDTAVCHSFGGFSLIYLLHHQPSVLVDKAVIMGAPGEAKHFFEFYKQALGLSKKAIEVIINQFKVELNTTPEYFSTAKFAQTISNTKAFIVHDNADNEAPVALAKALHKNWQDSQILITEGLGHQLKSKDLIEKVNEFIFSN